MMKLFPKNILLLIADQVFVFCIVAPLVVSYWRGKWLLLDLYILPNDTKTSAWISFVIGNIGMILLATLAGVFQKMKTDKKCSIKWIIGYHLYTYLLGFIGINLWRGTWILLDTYTGKTIKSNVVSLTIGLGLLYLLRASKLCCVPPVVCSTDTIPEVFDFKTRFKVHPHSIEKYILDVLLTTLVIHNMVVFYWRGCWGLLDLLLYPEDKTMSTLACLILAAIIFVVMIPVQIILLKFQEVFYHSLVRRIVLDDILYCVASFSCVLHWRAVWYICDLYLYPHKIEISYWITHSVGYLGLTLLLCSVSVMVKSFVHDGSTFEESTDIVFENEFFRYFRGQAKQENDSGEKNTRDKKCCISCVSSESTKFNIKKVSKELNTEDKNTVNNATESTWF